MLLCITNSDHMLLYIRAHTTPSGIGDFNSWTLEVDVCSYLLKHL